MSQFYKATSFLWCFLLLIGLTGCVNYRPRSIDSEVLPSGLSEAEKCERQQQATLLDHPRIAPINLDFSKQMTIKQLSVLAILISPDLKALRAKEGVACAQVFEAGLLPDPQLTGSYTITTNPIPNYSVNASFMALNWDIAAIVTREIKLKIARSGAEQTRFDIAWQEWLTANQVELCATKIHFLKQRLQVAQKGMKVAKTILESLKNNPEKDVLQLEGLGLYQNTYLDFVDQAVTLARSLKKTQLDLNQILGLPPNKQLVFKAGKLPQLKNLDPEHIFELAKRYRLDLLALRAGYNSQEAKLHQAVLGQFPHFSIGPLYSIDNTNIRGIGPNLNFDIPLFNRNRGAIAIQKATREQLRLEYIARLNQTRSDIAALVADIQLIKEEEKILEKQLPEMRGAEKQLKKELEDKKTTIISYNNILTDMQMNELRLLSLQQSAAEQIIALQMASGHYSDPYAP